MLSKAVIEKLVACLPEKTGCEGRIEAVQPVGGGSINAAYRFVFSGNTYFIKVNSAKELPLLFNLEASALMELRSASTLLVPAVVLYGQVQEEQFLLLENLEERPETPEYFYELGKGLALLHKNTGKEFGWKEDNYIGSLGQENTFCLDWNEFFVTRRLEPLIKMAIDTRHLTPSTMKNFDDLFKSFPEIFPKEPPALLHGDLWSGNKMNTVGGPGIFDPAIYYGHREVDISMTKLFGGFTRDFYLGYNECSPLEKGWEERTDVFNLYPLLVHVNLFGGSYAQDVMRVLKRFS